VAAASGRTTRPTSAEHSETLTDDQVSSAVMSFALLIEAQFQADQVNATIDFRRIA
jgi:hypothetical protein